MKQRQHIRKRKRAAIFGANNPDTEEQARRRENEEKAVESQLRRERQAFEAVQRDNGPGGAAEALRFLANRATEKEIRSSGGVKAVSKVLKTAGVSFENWRARWTSIFEQDIVRLVVQAGGAPRLLSEIKRLPAPHRGKIEARRVMRMAAKVGEAIVVIRELDADRYWGRVALPGLLKSLEGYRSRLQQVAQMLLRLDRSPSFKNLGHVNDEWVLESIRRLTGQPFRQKTTAIMRVVYHLDKHWPVEAESLARWQRRKRMR